MATKNEAKVRFTAETGDLNKAIASANSELTKLRSELRLNEAQAKGTGNSLDSLKDRARILGDEYAASQSKVDALSDKLEAAKSIFGENSVEAQKLETQLNNARVAQQKIAQQIEQTNSAMESMRSASAQAETALGKLGTEVASQEADLAQLKRRYNEVAAEQGASSTEARQLASQISKTSTELQENRTKLQQASTAADQFDRSLDGVGDSAKNAGKDLGVMDVALGDFISDTAQSGIQSLLGLEESTRQFRNEQSKLETVAATSGQSLDVLQQGYDDLYAITADETLASTAVLNMSAMGVSAEDQAVLVNAAAGAWAAYGDSIPLDGLLESINETSRAGQVTGSFADALNWANMSNQQWSAALSGNSKAQAAFNKAIGEGMSVEDAFNEALLKCTDTQERQELVTAAMDAAYGKLGDTYQETNADVIAANDAANNLTQAQAALGEAVAPLSTFFTNLIAGGLQWMVDNLPVVVPLVVGLGTAFTGFMVVNTIVPAVTGLVTGLGGLSGILAAITGPVGIAVMAVAALAAGFVALWNSSETFRNGVMAVWTTIQTVFGTLAEWFMTTVITPVVTYFQSLAPQLQAIWDGIVGIINIAMPTIQGIIQTVMGVIQTVWGAVWPAIQGVVTTVWSTIQTVINTVLGVIQGIITTVTGVISGDWSMVWEGISQVASSIWNGISSTISGVINGISSTIGSVISGISSNIGSVFNGIKSTVSSVWNGIKTTIGSAINGAKDVVGGAIDAIKGFFNFKFKWPHIPLPHFSISGSVNPLDWLSGGLPKISVSWYAEGGVMDSPTIFGMAGGRLLGGGEAGPEAIAPIDVLRSYIQDAVDSRLGGMGDLVDAIEALADRVISIEIDGRQLALATASDSDRVNGSRQNLVKRGVSLA